jgi:apolipoprotein N-acyltransferase
LKKTHLNSLYFTLSYFTVSAFILTMIQPPFHFSFFAWIAYVPLVIAAARSENKICLYLGSWLVAFVYWLGNIYWMAYVTVSGWIAFCAYTALLWPVLILIIRVVRRYKVPFIIAAPVLIVGTEQLQGFLLGGFYWRHLSHSQYANITLIQIADVFGAAGISFLVAMVNGFFCDLVLSYRSYQFKTRLRIILIELSLLCVVINVFIVYGGFRIRQAQQVQTEGPMIAAVQSNLPQSVKESELFEVNRQVFEELLDISKTAAANGAVLVVWPETIIPAIMDKGVWPYLLDANEVLFYNKALGEFAHSEGVYVLVGAPGGEIIHKQDGSLALDKYNSAFLYEPSGDQAPVKYSKIHLVPFGEVVPFKYSIPWLYHLLMKFSPYNFDYNLTPGTQFTVFNMMEEPKEKKYRFGVMICYESAIPAIARGFTLDENSAKKVDWLVNISNDGWFVKFSNGKVRPSTELQQHTIASVFRAVENRLSVIRSVNTGISCLVDPLGRIQDGYLAGDLPKRAFDRAGVEGYFADRVVIDGRVTVFSRYGQWLGKACRVIVLGILILLPYAWIVRNIIKEFGHK